MGSVYLVKDWMSRSLFVRICKSYCDQLKLKLRKSRKSENKHRSESSSILHTILNKVISK